MLEKVDLSRSLLKDEYQASLPVLQERLFELQKACWTDGIPVLILFEGWDAAGKGTCIARLTETLEPRGFRIYATHAPRTHETHLPWLYRFWLRVPGYGQMAIFDGSWYRRVLEERVQKVVPKQEWRKAYQDIITFERTLADDGCVTLKFFFHITRKEQQRRFRLLQADRLTSWQITPEAWDRHRKYKKYLAAGEEMLEKTETEWGPWTIVEATDRYWARVKVFRNVISSLESALRRNKQRNARKT